MRDDANAFHTQQRRAAIFGVVEALLKISERTAREQRSYLPRDRRLERFFQSCAYQIGHAFGNFQRHVAHKTVSYDNVNLSVVKITTFDVSHKVQRQALKQLEGFAGKIISLGLFFADGEQADARSRRTSSFSKHRA